LADNRADSSASRKELNRQMRMAVKRFDLSETGGEAWAFLCECGDDSCEEWVTLPVKRYETLQRTEQPILAPGHTLSQPEKTGRTARRLVDGVKAKRNRRKKKPS
jgi:hypothetical protein